MSITVKKSTSGASFTVADSVTGITRERPCNGYELVYDANIFSLVAVSSANPNLIQNVPYGQIFNGETGVAFASMAALVTYAETNFFRKAGSGSGSLSASNFITGQALTGTINGTNTVFTIPTTGSLSNIVIRKNGVVQLPGTDYTLVGTTVTFMVAPDPGPPADSLTYDCIAQ